MKKLNFEKFDLKSFQPIDKKKMKSVKGGYTTNTVTITPSGGSNDGDDGIKND